MASERHEGDRLDKIEAQRALKNLHWRCRDCGFLTKDDDWPNSCPYCLNDRMRPAVVAPLHAIQNGTGVSWRPAERFTLTSRRKLSERIYWVWVLLFRWPSQPS